MESDLSIKKEQVKPLFREFIRKNLPALLIISITLVLGGLMEVFPVRYMQQIINGLIGGAPFTAILGLVGFWYGCRILGALANYGSGCLTGKIASKCGGFFRQIIFNRIVNSYYWDRENASTADVTTRLINDASELGDLIIKPLYIVGKNLFIFLWSVIFLAQIDWLLLVICIPLGGIMLLLGSANASKSRNVIQKVKRHETKLTKVILETLSAAKEMVVFNFGAHQNRAFAKNNEIVIDAQTRGARLLSALESSMNGLWPLATVVCLGLGSYRVIQGNLSVGGLVAFMWYVQWVVHPISQISNYKSQIQKSIVSLERIDELLGWYPGDCEPPSQEDLKGAITLENVSYQYPTGNKPGIHNINIQVGLGQTLAVVGRTGCGKSTLLKTFLGLVQPDTGDIILDGHPVQARSLHGAAFSAAAFSDPIIFNTSLRNNIVMDAGNGDHNTPPDLLEKVIRTTCIDQFLDELPQGIDTIIGQTGKGLSSGQMQRIALARALYKQPQLLILDEATDSIDSETEAKIFNAIKNFDNPSACVIVSHRLSSIKDADRIYYMEDGEIQAVGTHATLLSSCPAYQALFQSQWAAK